MLRAFLPALALSIAALPALADDSGDWRFGGDAYVGGTSVTVTGEPIDDLFAAGRNVTAATDITGSAHMLGQNITLDARVGQNLYAAGQDIEVDGPVTGDVTTFGQSVTVTEPISGNLRVAGQSVELTAPVAGSAIIGAEEALISSVITGDVALSSASITWGEGARVDGALHLYTDNPAALTVPETVAPSDRVFIHEAHDFDDGTIIDDTPRPSFGARLFSWLKGIVVVGLLGTLFAAVAPNFLASLRQRAIDRPVFNGMVGWVGISALIGSVVLLAMTGIGILLIPLTLIAAALLGVAGYVIGTYALGVWATGFAGRAAPSSTGDRAIAAFSGAALAAVIGLIPWLGWLAVMAIFLIGAGALAARTIRLEREDLYR